MQEQSQLGPEDERSDSTNSTKTESDLPELKVPNPDQYEELRQLAETINDLRNVINIIVKNANLFIPGESVDEIITAWETSENNMTKLVRDLIPYKEIVDDKEVVNSTIIFGELVEAQLTGDVGKLKKSNIRRLIDGFFKFWNTEPRTDEKRAGAMNAASELLDAGATIVSSIPGHEVLVEIISITRQLIDIRSSRGF